MSPDNSLYDALEWPRLLKALEERLGTPYGRQNLESMVFLDEAGAVMERMGLIAGLREMSTLAPPPSLQGVIFLETHLERAQKGGALEPQELWEVLRTLETGEALAGWLKAPVRSSEGKGEAGGQEQITVLAQRYPPQTELEKTLAHALTPGGELNEGAFPLLKTLAKEIQKRKGAIHKRLDGMLRAKTQALQERVYTLRANRYVLPVKADFRGQVRGIVHDASASGQTLFIEPEELVEEGNLLTLAEKKRFSEIQEILARLTAQVGQEVEGLIEILAWVGEVDLRLGQAALAAGYGGSAPEVKGEGCMDLRKLAHPLMRLAGETPVANDVTLGGEHSCMVISGANTGGKTVLLKSVGLCALLVKLGMLLPVGPGSRFDLFENVCADIGDHQSLEQSLSTFSAQVQFLAETLKSANQNTLVLIDEMLTGTSPEEGAALATEVLSDLEKKGATCIVTTHYGEVKELAAGHPHMVNASVAFDLKALKPTYRLLSNMPGASFAFDIALRHGLSETLAQAARERLAQKPASAEALLAQLHQTEHALKIQTDANEAEAARLKSLEKAHEAQAAKLDHRERELKTRERGKINQELEAGREKIRGLIKDLQGANDLPRVTKLKEQFENTAAELLSSEATGSAPAPAPLPQGKPVSLKSLKQGLAVRVVPLGKQGVVETFQGEKVGVSMGGFTLEVALGDLEMVSGGSSSGKKKARGPSGLKGAGKKAKSGPQNISEDAPRVPALFLSGDENTLDLRGVSLEEALERTEGFLDKGMHQHLDPLLVIHGHGTGKLKKGLREALKTSAYVAGFRPGEPAEGGDGVTVIALNL